MNPHLSEHSPLRELSGEADNIGALVWWDPISDAPRVVELWSTDGLDSIAGGSTGSSGSGDGESSW